MKKYNLAEKIFIVAVYIILGLFALTTLYPFVYTLSMSLSSLKEAARVGLHLYPREISFTSYQMVLKNTAIYSAYGITLFRTIVGTIGALIISTLYGYAISRKELPCKKLFTSILVFTMIFSGGTVPIYLLIKNIGLLNNVFVYILPNLIGAYNVVILKSYFESIPESLYESARIDGAHEWTIWAKIIMPISKPVLATVALWIIVFHWNQWMDCLLYIQDSKLFVLQRHLQRIIEESNLVAAGEISPNIENFSTETVTSATIIVTILPILCVYPFIQKYFTTGIMLGSVKG